MATDYWLAGPETHALLKRAIREYHPEILDISDKIALLFRDPGAKSGGVVTLGSVTKANTKVQTLSQKDFIYIFEIAATPWQLLNESQRLAFLDHLLCHCQMKEDEKTGDISYTTRSPEIKMFKGELRRHGVWRDIEDDLDEDESSVDHGKTVAEMLPEAMKK